ncbi:MAG TPA: hypothetical protein VEK12_06250 [Alphaproteobacteria bacterium]|nr:hypothetical protein [Alphaproteobacteria bacterium]
MTKAYALLSAGILLTALSVPAHAQVRVPCAERAQVVDALQHDFAETQVASGLTPAGQLLEIFASDKGTWTVILSLPTGKSCMIANGDAWNSEKKPSLTSGKGA